MPIPKLTCGIPHLDRTTHLEQTIDCLLDQSEPCRILVADQGHTASTAELMKKYVGNDLISWVQTDATCLWENWKAAANAATLAGAEYFSWVQDDDIVHHRYAERIHLSFDTWPDVKLWTARLACAEDKEMGIWYSGCGPLLPMNIIKNKPRVIPGILMPPISYITSWALSPAVAFRCGDDFQAALDQVPLNCDLYNERTILAAMGARGDMACDPCVLGYWIHHGKNESYRQNATTREEQDKIFFDWLDGFMDDLADDKWQDILLGWAWSMPNSHLVHFIAGLEKAESRYSYAVAQILKTGMKAEVSYEELRKQYRRAAEPTIVAPVMI